MEHEMIAWLISLHFIKAVERALQLQQQGYRVEAVQLTQELITFPAPLVSNVPQNDLAVINMLYGHKLENSTSSSIDEANYVMKQVSCRTDFLPATDGENVLSSIVVSGLAHDVTPANIMTERSDLAYHWGWVYDVSQLERDTKVKVEKCGGLGYVDMKIALYGLPESGTLRFWLPSEQTVRADKFTDESARSWFNTIVVCEANEKRSKEACQLDTDLEYTVGGVAVTSTSMVTGAGAYLKRQTCVHVGVPQDAKITHLKDVTNVNGDSLTADQRAQLGKGKSDNFVGIVFDLKAKVPVTRKNGACCVSHVVWEHHNAINEITS
jgi:hypothetical protein